MIDHDSANGAPAPGNARLLDELRAIVRRRHVPTSPQGTRRCRTGFRFGTEPALAVLRSGALIEQWKMLKARAGPEYIVSGDCSCLVHQQGCAECIGLPLKFIQIAQIPNGGSA